MALTINTNIASLIAQRSLESATKGMNTSLERMSTGYKINHSKDNAAGYSIANKWETQLGSLDVAANNAATGMDLLTTAEETYSLLTSHLQRVRDLTEQAANGTYGSASLKSIQAEVYARLQEISRIAANSEFNGIKLMAYSDAAGANNSDVGMTGSGINLQVGLDAKENSVINLNVRCFKDASVSGLFGGITGDLATVLSTAKDASVTTIDKLNSKAGMEMFAAACTGLKIQTYSDANGATFALQGDSGNQANAMLKFIDGAINEISVRATTIGAAQNRVESAITALDVQSQNLTSSLSTLRDTDVASESSSYIQQQILQQASATLLSTANQLPSIALNLI
jgi:flagellin